MTLSSMTGFARATGQDARLSWTFELKCVNGRSLEVRCRLPPGLDALEPVLRSAASAVLQRGNLNVALQTVPLSTVAPMRINRAALDAVLGLIRDVGPVEGLGPARLDGVLALRGVIEAAEPEDDEATRERRLVALKASFDQALASLVNARQAEGAALAAVLGRSLDAMAALSAKAEGLAALRPEAVRERLRTQVKALLDAGAPLPEERLAQELALIAVKLDVREELDRLKVHEASARQLIGEGGAVGRRLDFLSQEFNREANTLCAKSNDPALTAIGLELKALIDQFREQVQNVE